jgi:hypothetical protein
MMHWFGEPWPSADLRAAVCEDDNLRVPLPDGQQCPMCDGPLEKDDRGVVIPAIKVVGILQVTEIQYIHLQCMLMAVGI